MHNPCQVKHAKHILKSERSWFGFPLLFEAQQVFQSASEITFNTQKFGSCWRHLPVSDSLPWSKFLLSVMSLCETRNKTTSLFSFFMGTISNKHQNLDPFKRHEHITSVMEGLSCSTFWGCQPYRFFCREWSRFWTRDVHPEQSASVKWGARWSRCRTGSGTCSSSASALRGQSRSVHRSHRSSRLWDRGTGPEHSPGQNCCLDIKRKQEDYKADDLSCASHG